MYNPELKKKILFKPEIGPEFRVKYKASIFSYHENYYSYFIGVIQILAIIMTVTETETEKETDTDTETETVRDRDRDRDSDSDSE